MNPTSNNIPRSLQPYLEQYYKEPEKAIERLEHLLTKRGPDAVGFYLLAWFYYNMDNHEQAVQAAWKAKVYAPGSPAMEQLHYFMKHPKKFKAWKPTFTAAQPDYSGEKYEPAHPIHDLDTLINRLSGVEAKRIQLEEEPSKDNEPDLSEEAAMVEDIVTETLAGIHERQGNLNAAIRTFERLKEINPEKTDHYQNEIERLEKKKEVE